MYSQNRSLALQDNFVLKTVFPRCMKMHGHNPLHSLCLLALLLGSCSSEDGGGNIEIQADQLSLGIPTRIRQVQALDIENVEAIATVDGQQYELTRNGEQFRTSIPVASNRNIGVSILFRERLDNGGILELANYASTLQIGTSNQTLQVFDNDFNDSPFDNDNDQISNLVEREEGTDPFVFDIRPENRTITIDFSLPRIIDEPQVTQVIATIAGTPRPVQRNGNDFEISGIATTRSTVAIEIILLQRVASGIPLVLANATRTVPSGIQPVSIDLNEVDFDFDRDQDGDGRTNLQELQNGTDPFRPD